MEMLRPRLVEGEVDRFVCPAELQGKLGQLYLTNMRAAWMATDAQAEIQRVEMNWYDVKDFQVAVKKNMIRINSANEDAPFKITVTLLSAGFVNAAENLASAQKIIKNEIRAARSLGNPGAAGTPAPAKSLDPKLAGGLGWSSGRGRKRGILASAAGGQPLSLASLGGTSDPKRIKKRDLARSNLLAQDRLLKQQFDEVVNGAIVTEEEFWAARQDLVNDELARTSAVLQGAPTSMIANVKAVIEDNKEKYQLTPQVIRQIFVQFPAVERAYVANVPLNMSEREFWIKYFQSQYRERESGGGNKSAPKISAGDDMFSRYAAEIEEENRKKEASGGNSTGLKLLPHPVDPTIDLVSQFSDFHSRETDVRSEAEQMQEADAQKIVNMYNRHASHVLYPPKNSDTKRGKHKAPLIPDDDPVKATDLLELREMKGPAVEPLTLSNADLYKAASRGSTAQGDDGETAAALKELKDRHFCILTREPLLSEGVPTPARALTILRSCTKETSLGAAAAASRDAYPQEFVTRMHRHFQVISELLRHFYGAYKSLTDPGSQNTGKAVEEKRRRLDLLVEKMVQRLNELSNERGRLTRDKLGNQMSTLIKPLSDSLSHAFDQYEKMKESNKK
jgi:hypothetical protein